MTPRLVDHLLSRMRLWPGATLESRAELALAGGRQVIPRRHRSIGYEHDPLLAKIGKRHSVIVPERFQLGLRPWLGRRVEIRSRNQVTFGKNAIVLSGTILNGRSRKRVWGIECGDDFYVKESAYIDSYGGWIAIGRGAALAQGSVIHGNGGVTVGDYLMMGHGAMILAGNHRHLLSEMPFVFQGSESRGVKVGHNVWIGAGAQILDGSVLGDNVVVGAGTVVAGKVPSNSIVTGERALEIRPLRAV